MRAVQIKNGSGPAENLFLTDVPTPEPTSTEILVQVRAFALNRMDLSQREGRYPVPPKGGNILGVEFSGVVKVLGAAIQGEFDIGDEVFGLTYGGAYAEYVCVEVGTLVHKPKELSWVEAAGISETWMTAIQALYLISDFGAGKTIMWHAGASGVSIAGIQLSIDAGAKAVYATAGSDEKLDLCTRVLGATEAFNYKTQDFAREIERATDGQGVDVIVDFVGKDFIQKNLDCVARDGCIVALASLSGTIANELNLSAFVRKRVRLQGSSLRSRNEEYQAHLCKMFVTNALPRLKDKTFIHFVEVVFPWEKIIDAQKLMESNQTKGKIICTISNE